MCVSFYGFSNSFSQGSFFLKLLHCLTSQHLGLDFRLLLQKFYVFLHNHHYRLINQCHFLITTQLIKRARVCSLMEMEKNNPEMGDERGRDRDGVRRENEEIQSWWVRKWWMGGKRDRWAGSISELSAKEKGRSERVLTKSKKMTHTHRETIKCPEAWVIVLNRCHIKSNDINISSKTPWLMLRGHKQVSDLISPIK